MGGRDSRHGDAGPDKGHRVGRGLARDSNLRGLTLGESLLRLEKVIQGGVLVCCMFQGDRRLVSTSPQIHPLLHRSSE